MVMSLGHCHPRLVDVVQRQVAELSFTYRFSFRNGPMLELAEELRSISPLADTWCFFNSSGSESVESAIQLALRYWQLRGVPVEDRPDLALAVVPRLDARRALALGLEVARVLRDDPRQAPGRAGAERRHPPAPCTRRGGGVGRARARGRDPAPRSAERRRRRDRAGDGRLGRRDRAAARLHGRAAAHLRPPRRAARVRRDDHRLRSHGGVVRRLPLAGRDAGHHHVREGRDERHRAVLGRARERRGGRAVRAVAGGLPLRAHVLRLPARLRRRGRGDPRDPRRGSRRGVAAQGRAAARAPGCPRGDVAAHRRRARPRAAAGPRARDGSRDAGAAARRRRAASSRPAASAA